MSGLTPAKAAALRRLDEEAIATRVAVARRQRALHPRTFEPSTERFERAVSDFLRTLPPPRNPSAELIAERRARFDTECSILRAANGVEAIFRDATLTDLNPRLPAKYRELAAALLRLVDEPAQVAIVGDRGRGKTWLACAAVNAFCDVGRRAAYRRTKQFFADLSTAAWADKEKVRAAYASPQLLVLDEVQVRDADREWQDNELTDLVDRRYARDRSTVLLANLEPAELWTNLGASIQRRVIETGGVFPTPWERIQPLLGGGLAGGSGAEPGGRQ